MPASCRASSSQSISPINEQMSVPWVTKYHKAQNLSIISLLAIWILVSENTLLLGISVNRDTRPTPSSERKA